MAPRERHAVWLDWNCQRWHEAQAIDQLREIAVCDTNPFKLHYTWSLWRANGPAWWLDERDAARAAANDPEVQAVQREQDRQQAEAATGLHRDADGVYRAPAGTRWSKARRAFVPAADPEPLTV